MYVMCLHQYEGCFTSRVCVHRTNGVNVLSAFIFNIKTSQDEWVVLLQSYYTKKVNTL